MIELLFTYFFKCFCTSIWNYGPCVGIPLKKIPDLQKLEFKVILGCLTGVHIVLGKKENNQAHLVSEGYFVLLGDMV